MYNLMYAAFQRLRTDVIATLSFIYPLVAVVADVLVLGTKLAPGQVLGMVLILATLVVNQHAANWTARVASRFLTVRSSK